jgi:hypothetical protein
VYLGQTVDVPVTLEVGAMTESVDVTATAPPLAATGTTIGASLDSATLSALPVGRRFSDILYLAPGVSSSGSLGNANPSVSGASGLENQYVVDGVNITNGGTAAGEQLVHYGRGP